MLLSVGPAFQMLKGFGAVEVEKTYSRARELCERLVGLLDKEGSA